MRHQVVLQDNDLIGGFQDLVHARDDRSGQAAVLFRAHDVDVAESACRQGNAPDSRHLFLVRFPPGAVDSDEKVGSGRQVIGRQRSQRPTQRIGAVVSKKDDGGGIHHCSKILRSRCTPASKENRSL